MTTLEILSIILTHYIADFVFQAESWSLGKSKAWSPLLKHTATYSLIWVLPIWLMTYSLSSALLFCLMTFVAHTVTDYFTSRIVSKRFEAKYYGSPIPNFGAFSVIGFDQVLHYTQLFLCYELFK